MAFRREPWTYATGSPTIRVKECSAVTVSTNRSFGVATPQSRAWRLRQLYGIFAALTQRQPAPRRRISENSQLKRHTEQVRRRIAFVRRSGDWA